MLRNGVDIVSVARLENINPAILARFIDRIYTPAEQSECAQNPQRLAGLFAAKEAVSKALGTGIGKIGWHEIEILHQKNDAPLLILHGNALRIANELGLNEWAISISHDGNFAIASVIAIGEKSG